MELANVLIQQSSVGITSVDDQTLISACIQIWNLICASAAAIMVDKAGRRGLFLASVRLGPYLSLSGGAGGGVSIPSRHVNTDSRVSPGHHHADLVHHRHRALRELRQHRQRTHRHGRDPVPLHVSPPIFQTLAKSREVNQTTMTNGKLTTNSSPPASTSGTTSR